MQTSVISQASITKGCRVRESWYDHGDFTVLLAYSPVTLFLQSPQ
ncbi:hypothetical protein [Vibrio splendidus]|nr:hypothetical protein [Vibrio splendidus]